MFSIILIFDHIKRVKITIFYMVRSETLMLTYSFQDRKSESLYEYLYNRIKEDILSGRLSEGERLPSKRSLAENLNMHRGSLSRSFSKAYGTSISDYIIHTRLQAAMTMLKETSLSVREIAENCGFSSGNYFAKVFSASEGVTPTEYRRLHTKMQ